MGWRHVLLILRALRLTNWRSSIRSSGGPVDRSSLASIKGGSAQEVGNPPAYVVPNCPPRSPMPAGRFVAVGACALHLSLSLSFIACHWYRVCVCVCVSERERVQQLRLCARDVNAIRTPASAARFAFFIVDGAAAPARASPRQPSSRHYLKRCLFGSRQSKIISRKNRKCCRTYDLGKRM